MKKLYFMTLDCETATLPFANEMCKNASQKQKIAIAKPLIYDLGWTISDRQGNIVDKKSFLIQETFFVPNVFNTAYYRDKRPMYMEKLEQGLIEVATWEQATEQMILALEHCDLALAYNACFDFKKALPFTERYMRALYSANYQKWEDSQRIKCKNILNGCDNSSNPDYLKPFFKFRGVEYPIADLWGLACDRLINIPKYKNFCLENELLTKSGIFFKTSAETTFRYLLKQYDFIEEHTALADAEIECEILTKVLKKGRIEPQIREFPFRDLGETVDYVLRDKPKYKDTVRDFIIRYEEENGHLWSCPYATRIQNIIFRLGGYY